VRVVLKSSKARLLLCCLAAIMGMWGCSTTKLIPEGQYRLASNKIKVSGDKEVSPSGLYSYIRQQPNSSGLFGWNPFLNIYNWSNGSGGGINAFWEKIGTPPVVFDSSLVSGSVGSILSRLEYLGYYDASVEAEISTKRRLANVTYNIETGARRKIDEIVYDVPEGEFGEDFRSDSLSRSIKEGDYLSEKALEAETERGAAYFRNLGYYNFNKNHYFFRADTLSPSRTVLDYSIKGYTRNENASADAPIRKYYIGDVQMSLPGNVRFNEKLLRSLNTILPGERYSEDMVSTTYSRLSSLGTFGGVNIEMTPTDSSKIDCNIRLEETSLLGFKLRGEVSSNSSGLIGLSPQLDFYHKSLFGGGERLNLGFSGAWQSKVGTNVSSTELSVSGSLSLPRALGFPLGKREKSIPRTELRASFNYQRRPEYRRSLASLSYGYSGQFGDKLFFQFYPAQFSFVKLYDISETFSETLIKNPYLWDSFTDNIDIGMRSVLYYTSDASIVPKSSYSFARFSFDLSGNVVSLFDRYLKSDPEYDEKLLFGLPYSRYVRAELSLGRTFRFGRDDSQAIALRADIGVGKAYSNSSALPFEKQFYCGGASSMRGWQVRSLGPGNSEVVDIFLIPSQTGDTKMELDLEYRFDMFWKLEGALFAEAGNIWYLDELKYAGFESIAGDWGMGLRLNLDFILLRFDVGFKVHDPSRAAGHRWLGPKGWFSSDGAAFHIGVGYPF